MGKHSPSYGPLLHLFSFFFQLQASLSKKMKMRKNCDILKFLSKNCTKSYMFLPLSYWSCFFSFALKKGNCSGPLPGSSMPFLLRFESASMYTVFINGG